MNYKVEYERWLNHANADIIEELRSYSEKDIEDSFYKKFVFRYWWSAWYHRCRH